MTGNISLKGSIRTCKIDTGYADRIYSDRFLNPNNMICSQWNGYDSAGRPVCPDSFMTKQFGCNSPGDRIFVENYQRPRYIEYIDFTSRGLDGDSYKSDRNNINLDEKIRMNELEQINCTAGNYGMQFDSLISSKCGLKQHERIMEPNQDMGCKY